jgi:putative ABC transport system ATP-binding protein
MSTAPQPVITVNSVNHYYGGGALRKQVLFEVSTEVLPGEIVILTGPSGSGKTTLLTLAGALRSVEEGSVKVLGTELNGANPSTLVKIRENIGFIFQAHNLLDSLTACQNVQMSLGVGPSLGAGQARARSVEMLEAVGLGQRVNHYPDQLSGGQRQRVAIARALVRRPKIILADEPTAALDRKSGREVVELMQQLAKQQGCAILLVTHDNRILDIADRILTLEDGRILSFASGLAANAGYMLAAFSQLNRRGDLVKHVRSLSTNMFLELLEKMTAEFEQFLQTIDLGNQETVVALFHQVLDAVTLKIEDLLSAERGTIFILSEDGATLESTVAHSVEGQRLEIRVPVDRGIAGRVARTGQTLNIPDPYSHPDFNPEVDKRTGFHTNSILCMPIFNRNKQVFAVAQLLNRKNQPAFDAADEKTFNEFAESLGLILESTVRLHRKQKAREEPAE